METKHKIGLTILAGVATAGLAYCAYLHRDDITKKIEEVKEEIKKKKESLGEMGSKKMADIIDSLIVILERHASGKHTAEELIERDKQIEKLREEIRSLREE